MADSDFTILIIDDDPALLRLLSIRISASGFTVIAATTAEEALDLMTKQPPHLVITDLRLPGMDGLALFEVLRTRYPSIPVILLTAHGSIAEAVQATARGIFSFLTKPYDSHQLLAQVKHALKLSGGIETYDQTARDQSWRTSILTRSPLMEEVLAQAHLVSARETSVLILGDSGTGKELLAQAMHHASPRRNHAFVPINCSAIPEELLESELFGLTKGAFTDAVQTHIGLFQTAHGGTLFLDEIGDLPIVLQVKLLRVLQDKQVRPVGSTQSVSVDVRIISATHRNLEEAIQQQRFREDLYYRLNVVRLDLPTLTQRREDIPVLARHFLSQLSDLNSKEVHGFAPDALEVLMQAPWPGNIRQLRNVVEQAFALTTTPIISATLVRKSLHEPPQEVVAFAEARSRFARQYLAQLLCITNGNVSQAARLAQRDRSEFYTLLRRHQLDPAQFRPSQPRH